MFVVVNPIYLHQIQSVEYLKCQNFCGYSRYVIKRKGSKKTSKDERKGTFHFNTSLATQFCTCFNFLINLIRVDYNIVSCNNLVAKTQVTKLPFVIVVGIRMFLLLTTFVWCWKMIWQLCLFEYWRKARYPIQHPNS